MWWPAPLAGIADSIAPPSSPTQQALLLRNFLIHNDGYLMPRGPIGGTGAANIGSLAHSSGAATLATFGFSTAAFVSYRATSSSPLVVPARVPINLPATAGELAQPVTGSTAELAWDSVTGGTLATARTNTDDVFGTQIALLDDSAYCITAGGPSTAVTVGVAPMTRITKRRLASHVHLTTGPKFVQDAIVHYRALFVAAGRAPNAGAGTDYNLSRVYFTRPGGTTAITDTVTDWQDPTSGLVQTIQVGADNDGDFIVGFGQVGGNLVIFKRKEIWMLYGTSPYDFTVRLVRKGTGCVDIRSVVSDGPNLYFASQRGYEKYDGQSFSLVSRPITDTWRAIADVGVAADTVNYGFIRARYMRGEYIFVSLGTDPHTANQPGGAGVSYLYYIPTGSWVELSSLVSSRGLSASGSFSHVIQGLGFILLMGNTDYLRCDTLTNGPPAGGGIYDRDTSTYFNIPMRWRTHLADPTDEWRTAQGKRVVLDWHQQFEPGAPAAAGIGTVSMLDANGAVLGPVGALSGLPTAPIYRRRTVIDNYAELGRGDVIIDVDLSHGATANQRSQFLRVYGTGLESFAGRDRRL